MQPLKDVAASGATAKWLSIVGIGESGLPGLAPQAREAIEEAAFVFGGARHLALARAAIRGRAKPWPVPFDPGLREVVALRGQSVCVIASGDPFLFGVGTSLARHVPAAEMQVHPAPSAFSLACARLGWSAADCEIVSLHGRPIDLARPLLHPGRRVLALTSDGAAPAAIAAMLCRSGFGASTLHVLEAMGGPDEKISRALAHDLRGSFGPLNLVGIEVEAEPRAPILPIGAGPDDDLFEHDGQITKGPIRAVTLAALEPRRGQTLWDVGAGSGSIAISWMLTHSSLAATAVELDPARAARIAHNAQACGVPGLTVVEGRAPEALAELPLPDAVFVGGGGSDPAVFDRALAALKPGGRLVANAVTLETEAELLRRHAQWGGDLTRLEWSRAVPVGGMTGWRPAMPVTQWRWVKP